MSASMSTLAGILKRIQGGEVVAQQQLKHRAMDEIAKSAKKYNVGGAGFYGAINDYGNESVGAISETEQFRTIDNEHYQQYNVQPKVLVAPVEVTGLLAKAADDQEEAFAEAVLREVEMAKERLLKDTNRQFFGLGTGALASPAAVVSSLLLSFTVDSVQYLRENMVLDSYTGSTQDASGLRISKVDRQHNIVHFSTSILAALTTTDVFVKQNIRVNPPADGKEVMGLRGIVDDSTDLTTFQGLDASAIKTWNSIRIDASSGNLTSDLLQRLIDDIAVAGGEEPSSLIMHRRQRRKYLDLVVPQKRYMDGKMDSGFEKLEFNGIELWLDYDCQINTVYGIDKSRIYKFEVAPLAMGNLDGSDTWLRASNFDKFQAYWRSYMNFGTDKRSAHGKIVSLATPSGIS